MSNKVKVCLDAGHVGSKYNQSPVVKTYYESAMVWSLHLKLKAALEARGFEVVTTRKTIDTKMDVYDRGTASKGCDVFLSLHSNACGTESVDYPVVYRAHDNLNNADAIALKIAKKIGELMGTTQAGRTATRKNSSGGEYYGVLRGARAVGTPLYLLIEHSFHTNTAAAKWLSQDGTWRSWRRRRRSCWRSTTASRPARRAGPQSWVRPRPRPDKWPSSAGAKTRRRS